MNRAARMVTTKTGITIGLLYQAPAPAPGYYAECIQQALLQKEPKRPKSLLVRVMRKLAARKTPCPPFMCAGSKDCPDKHCAGRIYGLYQRDGGMSVSGALSFPIEPETRS